MNRRDVEKFYNDYKSNIGVIGRLEKKLLKESYSYEKWYEILLAESKLLRAIYLHNVAAYDEVIGTFVKDPESQPDEVFSEFMTHIDFFITEDYRDYGVTVPVIKAMLPYWQKKGNPGREMDCYYFLGVSLSDAHYFGEACNEFTAALNCFDDFMDCPEAYWTFRYLCAAYYRLISYVGVDRYNEELLLKYYQEAVQIWTDERIPDDMISEKKKSVIPSVLRNLVCYAAFRMMDNGDIPSEEIIAIIVEEFEYEREQGKVHTAEVVYNKYLRVTGRLSWTEYEGRLIGLTKIIERDFELGYTYGSWMFTTLFDNELEDETFSADKLFFMNPSFVYVNYILSELITITQSEDIKQQISRSIYRYFLEFPAMSDDGHLDIFLYPILTVLIARCPDEDMLIDSILNILVHRQIATAIHVTMVARLGRSVTSFLLKKHPEFFIGVHGIKNVSEVAERADELKEFAYEAGLCHDVGKLTCTEVIRLQSRKILNEEFDRIKNHPAAGSSLLLNSDTLSDYFLIALCHHVFDDGSKGYPYGISFNDNPIRIFLEIITVCDSIDAMSDNLGRNYASAKEMPVILKELSDEMGTRYSERVVRTLLENNDLVEDLKKLLYEERVQVHYDIYRRFVVPDTRFRPEDEKYISRIEESSIDAVLNALNMQDKKELFNVCRDYSYVIKDRREKVYGLIMCEPENNNMWIRLVQIDTEYRRQGIGSTLLNHLEEVAHEDGFDDVFIPEKVNGHYDRFGWYNGYISSDKEDWLVKHLK